MFCAIIPKSTSILVRPGVLCLVHLGGAFSWRGGFQFLGLRSTTGQPLSPHQKPWDGMPSMRSFTVLWSSPHFWVSEVNFD